MPLQFTENLRSGGSLNFSTGRAVLSSVGLTEATQAEAEAGAVLGVYMSPLRTRQAFNAFVETLEVFVPDSPVTKTTIQAAIDAAIAAGGGRVWLPTESVSIDTSGTPLTIGGDVPIIIESAGGSAGSGAVLVASNVAGHMFSVTSSNVVAFRDFGISTAVTKNSATAGIYYDTSSTGDPETNLIVERMRINGQYVGIEIVDGAQFTISDNEITPQSTGSSGIIVSHLDAVDSGSGKIINNKIWNIAGVAADAGIRWARGSGTRIRGNRILGAFDYGVHLKFDKTFGDDGAVSIVDNTIEVQDLYGIYIERTAAAQAAGRKIGQLVITANHIQALGSSTGYQNAIAIESSTGGGWVEGAVIADNIIQNSHATPLNNAMIRIDDGVGISVNDNVIYLPSPGEGGIRVAGNAASTTVDNNRIVGGSAANRYPSINSTTMLRDFNGITFAAIPSSAANGSSVYVTDGTAGAPLTGSGTGAMAIRINGAWQGFSATFPVNMGGTGAATFTANGVLYGNGTSAIGVTSASGAGSVLISQAGPGAPAWSPTPSVTSLTAPTIIGGSGTTGTQLTLKTTTGNGTTDALAVVGGNNGATPFGTFTAVKLDIPQTTATTSATTGALVVGGGIGAGGDYFGAGNFRIDKTAPTFRLRDSSAASGSQSSQFQVASGAFFIGGAADAFGSWNTGSPSNFSISTGDWTLGANLSTTGKAGFGATASAAAWILAAAGTTAIAPLKLTSGTNLTTAAAGAYEYDGSVHYTTPVASNRGVAPSEHFLSISANQTGADSATAQTWFPGGGATGITLPATTSYFFEGLLATARTAGTNSHDIGLLFAGTATITSIQYFGFVSDSSAGFFGITTPNSVIIQVATNTGVTAASANANQHFGVSIKGIVRINGAGTFIPQFKYSAAPGGAPTVQANSWFRMYPVGTNTVLSVGNWS